MDEQNIVELLDGQIKALTNVYIQASKLMIHDQKWIGIGDIILKAIDGLYEARTELDSK